MNINPGQSRRRRSAEEERKKNEKIRDEAKHWWNARQDFREQRDKNRDFYRGRQWEEKIYDPDTGRWVEEKEFLEEQNRMPWVMNMVNNLVSNVKGQFRRNRSERSVFSTRKQDPEAVEMLNLKRRAVRRQNRTNVLEADNFEEHILSGSSAFKSVIEWDSRRNREAVRTYQVDQHRLFYNLDVQDRRLTGLRMIGELHDVTMQDLKAQFAKTEEDIERLEDIYGSRGDSRHGTGTYGFDRFSGFSFHTTTDPSLHRVIEVWRREKRRVQLAHDPLTGQRGELDIPRQQLAQIQKQRRENEQPQIRLMDPKWDDFWVVYYLSPDATLLHKTESPYWHDEHPYTIAHATFLDGETWGLPSPVRDPQRWMNRNLAQIDHMMAAGAKGAGAIDKQALENTPHDVEDVGDWITRMDSVMDFNVPDEKNISELFHQFTQEQLPRGYFEMIPMLQQYIEKISGVTEAAQGFEPKSGTPASLFRQQIIQSSTNVLPFLSTYFEGLHDLDKKEIQLIQQAYGDPEVLTRDAYQEPLEYDPKRVREVDVDVSIGDVGDTITHRQLWDSQLMQFLEAGFVDFPTFLKASGHPLSDKLLKMLQQQQGGGRPAGQSPNPQGERLNTVMPEDMQRAPSPNNQPQPDEIAS